MPWYGQFRSKPDLVLAFVDVDIVVQWLLTAQLKIVIDCLMQAVRAYIIDAHM